MKVAVIGSRGFKDADFMKKILDMVPMTEIVSGGAEGADSLAAFYAARRKVKLTVYKPDWQTYGKKAGFIRNKQIIEGVDAVYAFWDGESRGTKHSIDLARIAKIPCSIFVCKEGYGPHIL